MSVLNVKFKRITNKAAIPTYANDDDACFDLVATSYDYDREHGFLSYKTDLQMEIPKGFVGLIFPRSSISKYDLRLTNAVGVIDAGYRGEISARFKLTAPWGEAKIYQAGDRICQMMILPIPYVNLIEALDLSSSQRGEGGFGSSDGKVQRAQ